METVLRDTYCVQKISSECLFCSFGVQSHSKAVWYYKVTLLGAKWCGVSETDS